MRSPLERVRRFRRRLCFDSLEVRTLLSGAPGEVIAHPTYMLASSGDASPEGLSPSAVREAYNFDQIQLPRGTPADGTGQTIAIVDAYDDPNIVGDLAAFDQQFGLPAPPDFSTVYASGSQPASDAGWSLEIALDVEWAHAIAPGASIVLVESASSGISDLMAAVNVARAIPDVSVVSMSWGATEFSGETSYDADLTTPDKHVGITFVASTGDGGAPGLWPAFSPNALSTGGTTLTLNDGAYSGETGWSHGGGGQSRYETEPSYQSGVQTSGARDTPDVAYDADPSTGFAVYDSVGRSEPWQVVAGTSAGAPQWSALIAIADEGRAALGTGSLDGAQALLYTVPATDFHDVVGGDNSFFATPGYDLVTGLGTPIANLVTADLIGGAAAQPAVDSSAGSGQTATVGQPFEQPLELTVVDQNGNPLPNIAVTFSAPADGASAALPDGTTATTDAQGQVTEPLTAGTVAGSYTVLASVAGISAPISFDLRNVAGPAASIVAQAGEDQQAMVGSDYQSVTALVEDQYGNPVPGALVTFAAPTGGPSATFVSGTTAITDSQGQASAALTADTAAGSYSVTASVAGISDAASFELTNLPGAPASIAATGGTSQQATVGVAFAHDLVATVSDQYGNPVPGVTVTFADAAPAAGALFSGSSTVVTDGQGEVDEPVTADTVAGAYTVTAAASGVNTSANFNLTNEPGSAASIAVVSGGNQQATIGDGFAGALDAVVTDSYGNPVPGVTVNFAAPPTGASALLAGGNPVVTDDLGQAGQLVTANGIAGSYLIDAVVDGVDETADFRLTNEASPTSLTLVASPDGDMVFGDAVTFTATIKAASSVASPSGTVTFLDGTTPLDTVPLTIRDGTEEAVFTPRDPLSVASHSISAVYNGDANDLSSQQSMTEMVGQASTQVGVVSSAPTMGLGRSITLTANVTAAAPGAGFPTGTIDFVDMTSGEDLGSVSLVSAAAQLTTSALAVGNHVIAARYSGDTNFESNAAKVTQQIVPLPTSSVAPLSGISLPTFTVSWSGDDAGGPGIAGYDVLVSDNGGPFTAWLTGTTQTSAQFAGIVDHTYGFLSVASDTLGDRQPLPATAQTSTAAIAHDANGLYVAAVYEQVLGRLPESTGLDYWAGQLDAGSPASSVAAAIIHSAEYYANEVVRPAYLKFLGRAADDAGVAWWTAQLQAGLSDEQFEAGLAASDEFYALVGGTNATWIAALYPSLLGRAVDPASAASLESELAAGTTRGQIADRVAASHEHEVDQIDADYERYLHRAPDPTGLAFWLAAFNDGQTDEELITDFVGSAEFYDQVTS
ncbi:MAG TPA: Ig-like domain-containing protein [Pirellulales bacterium]|nr:Ig-like domain-containing protein [Pirellulales bacterium]